MSSNPLLPLYPPRQRNFAEKFLPKEAVQVLRFLHEQTPASPSSQASSPTPGWSTSARTTASLLPKHKKRLRDRAQLAKETVRYRYEEGSKRASAVFWLVLMTTAILSSALSYSIDQVTWSMGIMRHKFTSFGNFDELLMITVFNVACCLTARLLVRTTVEAEGSGFPEVKAMLFGKVMPSYLTLRVLGVKAAALALGVGAGLPLGKAGPNVHMAACISRTIGPRYYQKRRIGESVAGVHLLLAACAVGVGSTFSAPIGGVVFALELVLPQVLDYIGFTGCFLSAVTGSICYAFYRTWTAGATSLLPMMSTDLEPSEGAASNYPACMLLLEVSIGAFCGLMGGFWIKSHAKVVSAFKRWRVRTSPKSSTALHTQMADDTVTRIQSTLLARRLLSERPKDAFCRAVADLRDRMPSAPWQWRDLLQIVAVVVLNTLGAASLPLLGGRPQPALLSHLFGKHLVNNQDEWVLPALGPAGTMLACFLFKWTITILALALPCPAGVVAPTMIIGGLLGRCIGLALPNWLVEALLLVPGQAEVSEDERGAFMARLSILGAAAFCAAVCRAFAMAITVFEALALPNALLPLCSSSLAAMFVANKIALPYFDTNLVGRGLGGISAITHTPKAQDAIFTVMRHVDIRTDCLDERTTLGKMRWLLQETDESDIPIVQTVSQDWANEGMRGMLKGCIAREDLTRMVRRHVAKDDSEEVNLFEASFTQPDTGNRTLVHCTPIHVDPDALIQEVYLIMKITHSEVVFVTRNNCVLGVVNFKDLLGHKLN